MSTYWRLDPNRRSMSQARRKSPFLCGYFRASLDGGGEPQIGEVTCGWVLERIPLIARHPVWWCCILMHPPAHPAAAHFDPLRLSQWEERLNSARSNPDRPEQQPRSRFGWSHHWAVTSFFLTLIRRRHKTILLFEKSKESLSVDMVHLYLYQHIISHKWHISYINRPIPDASGATLHWRPIVLLIERFTITFTANGKTSIWTNFFLNMSFTVQHTYTWKRSFMSSS